MIMAPEEKSMPHYLASALILALILGPHTARAGATKPVSEQFPPFHALSISPLVALKFTQGPTQSVSVTATPAIRDHLDLAVHNGVLEVHTKGDLTSFSMNDHSILLTITLPQLTRIDDSGLVHGTLSHLSEPALTLNLSGAASLTLTGHVQNLTTKISGDARLHARHLTIDTLNAQISGVGQIDADVTKSVTLAISGVGHVHITGNPPVRHVHASGVSSVTFN
jgi:hypothetical protein